MILPIIKEHWDRANAAPTGSPEHSPVYQALQDVIPRCREIVVGLMSVSLDGNVWHCPSMVHIEGRFAHSPTREALKNDLPKTLYFSRGQHH